MILTRNRAVLMTEVVLVTIIGAVVGFYLTQEVLGGLSGVALALGLVISLMAGWLTWRDGTLIASVVIGGTIAWLITGYGKAALNGAFVGVFVGIVAILRVRIVKGH